MALTLASDLTFKSMKGTLKRVFGRENVEKDRNFDHSYLDSQIKQENVCYTQQPSKQKKGQFNPLTKQGVVSRCASRKWYNKVKSFLLSLNLKMSKGDLSTFYYYKNDKLSGIVAIHVDDFLWAGDVSFSNIPIFCKIFGSW